jgi:hypothetical protein
MINTVYGMEGFSQELQSVSELVPKLKIAPPILVFKIINLELQVTKIILRN